MDPIPPKAKQVLPLCTGLEPSTQPDTDQVVQAKLRKRAELVRVDRQKMKGDAKKVPHAPERVKSKYGRKKYVADKSSEEGCQMAQMDSSKGAPKDNRTPLDSVISSNKPLGRLFSVQSFGVTNNILSLRSN